MSAPLPSIALLGTGRMGAPIARNLFAGGYHVTVWNRTRAQAATLAGDGADVADSPAVAATGADVVISMLTDGPASEAVMSGPDAWPAVARARRSRAHRAARDDPPVVAGVPSRAH